MPTSTSDLQRSPSLRLLSRFKSLKRNSLSNGVPQIVNFDFESRTPRPRLLSLESLMSYGLGSDVGGETISELLCGNQVHVRGSRTRQRRCTKRGVFSCPKLSVILSGTAPKPVKNTTGHTIALFALTIRTLMRTGNRRGFTRTASPSLPPRMKKKPTLIPPSTFSGLNITKAPTTTNEISISVLPVRFLAPYSLNALTTKIKLLASNSIRTLIKTINSLPKDYPGRVTVLFNSSSSHGEDINRSLVILYTLCASGPSIDESAELVTHLLYSRFLTPQQAGYVRSCVDYIYGSASGEGEGVGEEGSGMSFRATLPIRAQEKGKSSLSTIQTAVGPRQLLEMFSAKWDRDDAVRCIKDEGTKDSWELFLSKLQPSHRLAFQVYRDSGVLLPFALGLDRRRCKRVFSEVNRLLFSSGKYIGTSNPLREWSISNEEADIFGSLFFHVKTELKEFARRMRDFRVEVLFTQFDERVLVRGLSSGVFGGGFGAHVEFDRILVENLGPGLGLGMGMKECLANWAPLLNRRNLHSYLLLCVAGRDTTSASSSTTSPTRNRHTGPRPLAAIVRKYSGWVTHPKLKLGRTPSPKHVELMEEELYVHDKDFLDEDIDVDVESLGVYRRTRNRVYPNERQDHQERNELGQVDFNSAVRYIEFARRE
ncbi:hypothetical protein VNI00_011475 [Paramarasmius palmivorus]|uniref:DUF4470 domain-containing protein n=1 Tax=Paramarasmius palmivorus TaxID=297713 RepID=A0AAW0CCA6_9AGAR